MLRTGPSAEAQVSSIEQYMLASASEPASDPEGRHGLGEGKTQEIEVWLTRIELCHQDQTLSGPEYDRNVSAHMASLGKSNHVLYTWLLMSLGVESAVLGRGERPFSPKKTVDLYRIVRATVTCSRLVLHPLPGTA